jgi:Rrf2 family transcriptional regulator, iron-sulfur cluster assembly transcription factor
MLLTLTGEYALRAMVYLAQNGDGESITSRQIAEGAEIPSKYLSKVLSDLVRAGVLCAARGKTGGFTLARQPERIRLAEVLAPFEPVLGSRRPCPFGNLVCSDEDPCAGHYGWKRVRDEFTSFLDRTTVRDVALARDVEAK